MKLLTRTILTLVCTLGVGGPLVYGQDQARIDTGRNTQDIASGLSTGGDTGTQTFSGEVPALEGDKEYGEQQVIHRPASWEPWYFRTDVDAFFTDNAALSRNILLQDWYFRVGAEAGYTPQIKGNLFGDFSVSKHMYFYDELEQLDFDYLETTAGLTYIVPKLGGIATFLNYNYFQIANSGFGSPIFDNHALVLGAQKVVPISRGQKVVLAYTSEISLDASGETPRRDEHYVVLAYSLQWLDNLSTTASYRAAFYDYELFQREDWNHAFALSVLYDLTDNISVNARLSYGLNDSNYDFFSYDNWQVGMGLGFTMRF